MGAKTERVTILTTPDFKAFLSAEALKEGISVSELIRERCLNKPANDEEETILKALIEQVNESTEKAKQSLSHGLKEARKTLKALQQKRENS
jgi:hypothetical protein